MTAVNSTRNETSVSDKDDLFELRSVLTEVNRESGPVIIGVNYVLLLVSVIIVVCDVFAVRVLAKSRRIPRRCLYFSVSFNVSDAVNSVFFSLFQFFIYCLNYNSVIVHYSRIFSIAIMNNISSASMGALMLERVVALKAGIRYSKRMNGARVKLSIVILWIVHALIIFSSLAVGIWNHCNWQFNNCNFWDATRLARFSTIGVMIFYDIILVTSYVSICRVAKRHLINILAMKRLSVTDKMPDNSGVSERQYSTTQAIIYVVIAFLILQAPINIHIILSETSDTIRHDFFMRILLGLSYLCIQVHSFINLYLYVGKFKECKMIFFFI